MRGRILNPWLVSPCGLPLWAFRDPESVARSLAPVNCFMVSFMVSLLVPFMVSFVVFIMVSLMVFIMVSLMVSFMVSAAPYSGTAGFRTVVSRWVRSLLGPKEFAFVAQRKHSLPTIASLCDP